MALHDLLASLERDARAEADALLAAARDRAARVGADAAARVARRRGETLGAREQALRAAAELAVAQARRAARARVLTARAAAMERVFAAAGAALPAAATSPPFLGSLPARLAAARACVGDAPAGVRCAPGLAAAVQKVAGPNGLRVVADPAVATGFVLAADDGSLEVDETLAAQLARHRPQLAVDIVRALDAAGP